jgi:hypothetical protein
MNSKTTWDDVLNWLYDKGCPGWVLSAITPSYYTEYLFASFGKRTVKDKLMTVYCRLRGHPYGVVWFTNDYEPDMTCKGCGDDIA